MSFYKENSSGECVYYTTAWFVDPHKPSYICKLKKTMHILKQAPKAWYNELKQHLLDMDF